MSEREEPRNLAERAIEQLIRQAYKDGYSDAMREIKEGGAG